MTTTKTTNDRAAKARAALTKATEQEQTARKALADARRALRKAGAELLAALAGDLELSDIERKAMGLPKAGAR